MRISRTSPAFFAFSPRINHRFLFQVPHVLHGSPLHAPPVNAGARTHPFVSPRSSHVPPHFSLFSLPRPRYISFHSCNQSTPETPMPLPFPLTLEQTERLASAHPLFFHLGVARQKQNRLRRIFYHGRRGKMKVVWCVGNFSGNEIGGKDKQNAPLG